MASLDIDSCHRDAAKFGGKCLETEYVNSRINMRWECKMHHVWLASYNSVRCGHWCKQCSVHRITHEECHNMARERGGEFLPDSDDMIIISTMRLKWRCEQKHEWKARYHETKNGVWCMKCCDLKEICTIEFCHDFATLKEGKFLSEEQILEEEITITMRTRLEWECKKLHKWSATLDTIFKKRAWCPYCSGRRNNNLQVCKDYAISKRGKCLSDKYVNKNTNMWWECEFGHQWESNFDNIKNAGHWCQVCGGTSKGSIEECNEVAEERGGKCLETEYKNDRTLMQWECSKLHTWLAIFANIKRKNSWCPHCASYKTEKMARETFNHLTGEKFIKCRPTWLEGLELDGYCKELNLAFEYNGQQHYEYIEFFHRGDNDNFIIQVENDIKKRRILKEKGIYLIDIPYIYTCYNEEELDKFIDYELMKFFISRKEIIECTDYKIIKYLPYEWLRFEIRETGRQYQSSIKYFINKISMETIPLPEFEE